MKQIIRRLERLEQAVGNRREKLDIIIEFVGEDNTGKSFITGGLQIMPGSERKELPPSFFDKEENHHEA